METVPEDRLQSLIGSLKSGTLQQVWKMLHELHPAEIAVLLESLRPTERTVVWKLVELEDEGEVLLNVNDEVRAGLIEGMDANELIAATEGMDMDDLADLFKDLPQATMQAVLRSMDKQNRQRLETVLSFPADSAGGLMDTDSITVRPDVTLEVVSRYLRQFDGLPNHTDKLIVVNRHDKYKGVLPLSRLLTNDPGLTVAEIMNREFEPIAVDTPAAEVASLFERRDLISAPVVDENQTLVGRITVDDVVDVIRDQADHSLMSMAGLDEEGDMFAPVVASTRRRSIWLGVNLVTVLLAAWVIDQFKATVEEVVALAVLMPIAASMGGVAGTQTLTLVIRGLALGTVGKTNARWLMNKELAVGALNGVLWSGIVAAVSVAWFQNVMIGVFIGIAMVTNLICAALAGFAIPFILQRLKIDPALAGSVILTTVTDVVGYAAFLGSATLYLSQT